MKKQKVIKITEANRDEVIGYFAKKGCRVSLCSFTIGLFYGITKEGAIMYCSEYDCDLREFKNVSENDDGLGQQQTSKTDGC